MGYRLRSLLRSFVMSIFLTVAFSSAAWAGASCGQVRVIVREVIWINGVESVFFSDRYLDFSHWLFGCLFV